MFLAASACGAEKSAREAESGSPVPSVQATTTPAPETSADLQRKLEEEQAAAERERALQEQDDDARKQVMRGGVEGADPSPTPEAALPGKEDKSGKPRIFQAVASELEGKIAQEDVSKALDDQAEKLRACISVDSTATVRLKVQPSGKVTEAKVSRTVPNDARMRDCIATVLRTISFPRLKGNEQASFAVDLMLKKGP